VQEEFSNQNIKNPDSQESGFLLSVNLNFGSDALFSTRARAFSGGGVVSLRDELGFVGVFEK